MSGLPILSLMLLVPLVGAIACLLAGDRAARSIALAATLDLRQIAALGAIYYLIMDIAIQWGLLRHLRDRVEHRRTVVVGAIVLDVVVLGAFVWVKASADPLGLWVAAAGIVLIVLGERLFMASHTRPDGTMDM